MANWDMFKVSTCDRRVMDRLKAQFSDVTSLVDGSVIIRAKDWEVPMALIDITKENEGARIITECCPISEQYFFVYTKEYYGGECKTIDIKINYCVAEYDVPEDVFEYDVTDRAIELLSEYDSVIDTGIGFEINANEDREISVEYMYRGYLVKAKKKGHFITIEIYDKHITWVKYKSPN